MDWPTASVILTAIIGLFAVISPVVIQYLHKKVDAGQPGTMQATVQGGHIHLPTKAEESRTRELDRLIITVEHLAKDMAAMQLVQSQLEHKNTQFQNNVYDILRSTENRSNERYDNIDRLIREWLTENAKS